MGLPPGAPQQPEPLDGVDMNLMEAIAVLVTVLQHPEDHRPEWPCVRTFELREAWLP